MEVLASNYLMTTSVNVLQVLEEKIAALRLMSAGTNRVKMVELALAVKEVMNVIVPLDFTVKTVLKQAEEPHLVPGFLLNPL